MLFCKLFDNGARGKVKGHPKLLRIHRLGITYIYTLQISWKFSNNLNHVGRMSSSLGRGESFHWTDKRLREETVTRWWVIVQISSSRPDEWLDKPADWATKTSTGSTTRRQKKTCLYKARNHMQKKRDYWLPLSEAM